MSLFGVELRGIARRKRYFVLRVLYGKLILFVLWSSCRTLQVWSPEGHASASMSIRNAATLASSFLVFFSWLQILSIVVVGPALAVGTIATERERRTIEYLFTTDLSNFKIVVDKTLARLTLIGKLVLVGLPILFLFRLLGGHTSEDANRHFSICR